jgi:hypothetical protein
MKPKSRVSKISIGRVYNLGNYEHVRYEITVDVPEGQSAAKAIVGLEHVIAGLKPLRHINEEHELARDAANIERMKKYTDEEWQSHHGHSVGTRKEVIARYVKAHREAVQRRKAAVKIAAKARALFDNLNGAEKFKDAKLDWDEGY